MASVGTARKMTARQYLPDVIRWPKDGARTVAFDLENTTPNNGRIFHFGAMGNFLNEPVSLVIDPEDKTGTQPSILLDRGISETEIRAARPFREHVDFIFGLIHGASVVIMHNRGGDWKNLMCEFDRCNHPRPVVRRQICTLAACKRHKVPRPHRLSTLNDFFNLPPFIAHNAAEDAAATYRLYIALLNRYPIYYDQLLPMEIVKLSPYFVADKPWIQTANLKPPPLVCSTKKTNTSSKRARPPFE